MTNAAAEPLIDFAAKRQARIRELRQAGDLGALIAAAETAADEIERRVGENRSDEEREALLIVKRFTYNVAADGWPGWAVSDSRPDTDLLVRALALARRSAAIVDTLRLGPLQEGTAIWLCGALELALGRYADADRAFRTARERSLAANAPGLALLAEGYVAIVRQIAGDQVPAWPEDLEQICTRIATGGFEDGDEWIAQLRTARDVFA